MDTGTELFHRILVGIDGTDTALHACRLADRLRAPGGRLLAVAVAETAYAVHTGFEAPEWADRLRQRALAAHDAILEEFDDPDVRAEVFDGRAADKLLALAREHDTDLVAVGRNGGSRGSGMLIGRDATRMIHDDTGN
jgi:nucleotide-binding universal stress UspA family protein